VKAEENFRMPPHWFTQSPPAGRNTTGAGRATWYAPAASRSCVDAVHEAQFEIAVETNGTQPAPDGLDWICVSPKAGAPLVLDTGDELKLVFPQESAPPEAFERLRFRHFFLQPMDGPQLAHNTELAVQYCKGHPQWRLSLQTHKLLGIP
jgi:organic radical activating enzyme